MLTWTKPVEGEYLPYQLNYIKRVPEGDMIRILRDDITETANFLKDLPAEKQNYRYAEGKWTIKEILQHLIDTERIMCYRALTFARNDKTELPGFEQDDYVRDGNANELDFREMVDEYVAVRNATIYMFKSFNDELLTRSGIANKGSVKVKSFAYVIAGHELHHMAIIREKYMSTAY